MNESKSSMFPLIRATHHRVAAFNHDWNVAFLSRGNPHSPYRNVGTRVALFVTRTYWDPSSFPPVTVRSALCVGSFRCVPLLSHLNRFSDRLTRKDIPPPFHCQCDSAVNCSHRIRIGGGEGGMFSRRIQFDCSRFLNKIWGQ